MSEPGGQLFQLIIRKASIPRMYRLMLRLPLSCLKYHLMDTKVDWRVNCRVPLPDIMQIVRTDDGQIHERRRPARVSELTEQLP
jgi:hypothetical protein